MGCSLGIRISKSSLGYLHMQPGWESYSSLAPPSLLLSWYLSVSQPEPCVGVSWEDFESPGVHAISQINQIGISRGETQASVNLNTGWFYCAAHAVKKMSRKERLWVSGSDWVSEANGEVGLAQKPGRLASLDIWYHWNLQYKVDKK